MALGVVAQAVTTTPVVIFENDAPNTDLHMAPKTIKVKNRKSGDEVRIKIVDGKYGRERTPAGGAVLALGEELEFTIEKGWEEGMQITAQAATTSGTVDCFAMGW